MKKKMTPTKNRPTKPITIRMPVDVLEDLKRVAPLKGFTGYQALIKFYIGQCLRKDLEWVWEKERGNRLDETLEEFGLKEEQKTKIRNILRTHPTIEPLDDQKPNDSRFP
jgi:hypothetical protein